uniref:WH2 domain-containing protein n=1 Tax=Strongyloides papillosus TaxID=174720 RepID=A0A0N5B898_STREA
MLKRIADTRSSRRRRYLCDISSVDRPSRPKNVPSTWHTKEDNDRLFDALGLDTFTIATGLCVLKCGSKGLPGYEEFRGIAVFAKDFAHRCNFIRVYHITTFELLYEIELLDMFLFKVHRSDRKRLTIKMGIHYADMIFAERSDMLQFKKKLCRIGIEKIAPSFTKRFQNYWDNTKKFFGNIIYEKKRNESLTVYSKSNSMCNDSVHSYIHRSSTLLTKKYKSEDSPKFDKIQRCGVKRKMLANDQDPICHDIKKPTNECVTSNVNVIDFSVYSAKTPNVKKCTELSNLPPSPPDTPKGILRGPVRNKLGFDNSQRDVFYSAKCEVKQVNFYSSADTCLSESFFPPPPVLKGAIRTVPRPNRNPPPPPSSESRILNNNNTPTVKAIPSDLLAEIRSAPQLREASKKCKGNSISYRASNTQSPLHLIRSAMLTRRKSIKEEESEDEGTRNTLYDTTDWSVTERYHDNDYHIK